MDFVNIFSTMYDELLEIFVSGDNADSLVKMFSVTLGRRGSQLQHIL